MASRPQKVKRPEYRIWCAMLERCRNAKSSPYHGGRGVTVCERWRASFQNFLDDLGPRPPGRTSSGKRPLYTLDRIDSNKNYEPNNCRWATYATQRLNQRPYDESARVLNAWKTRSRVAHNRVDLVGLKFGRLTVVKFAERKGHAFWLCRCDCGTEKVVSGRRIRTGQTKSCGCWNRERSRIAAIKRNTSALAKKGWITRKQRGRNGGHTWHGKG